jgi:hypothetical protein
LVVPHTTIDEESGITAAQDNSTIRFMKSFHKTEVIVLELPSIKSRRAFPNNF